MAATPRATTPLSRRESIDAPASAALSVFEGLGPPAEVVFVAPPATVLPLLEDEAGDEPLGPSDVEPEGGDPEGAPEEGAPAPEEGAVGAGELGAPVAGEPEPVDAGAGAALSPKVGSAFAREGSESAPTPQGVG